jgi:hypothetical protein
MIGAKWVALVIGALENFLENKISTWDGQSQACPSPRALRAVRSGLEIT